MNRDKGVDKRNVLKALHAQGRTSFLIFLPWMAIAMLFGGLHSHSTFSASQLWMALLSSAVAAVLLFVLMSLRAVGRLL